MSRSARAAIAAASLAGVGLLAIAPLELCFFALALHVPCPGCGMTRAALAIARGDLQRALALHPLSFVATPWACVALGRHALAYVRTGDAWRTPKTRPLEQIAAGALVVLLVALWAARFFGYFGGPAPV